MLVYFNVTIFVMLSEIKLTLLCIKFSKDIKHIYVRLFYSYG